MDSITINQMGKITNAQFKELQNKITQVIFEKEVQEILKDRKFANNSNVTPLICQAQVAGYFINLILDSRSSVNLDIAKAISVHINSISIETDMEVFEAKKYIIIVGNKWLKKAKALLDYKLLPKQNQEEKQSDELDDDKNNKEEDQEKQEETTELAYTIFTKNDKSEQY
ncbi:hypothetical protein G9A89_008394 [Geosiphon pyriformis]|nr:hypothetical protein G9A89_008394 [Geosiphon pyriformis]